MSKVPAIKVSPIKSSSANGVGYDSASKTLAVSFTSGQTYHYHNVPHETYQALMKATSFGKALQSTVVGKFKHTKV